MGADSAAAPWFEPLVPPPDPVRCCEQLAGLPYRLFLDSAATGTPLGRFSFLTADPVAIVRSKGTRTEYLDRINHTGRVVSGDALAVVQSILAPHACAAM